MESLALLVSIIVFPAMFGGPIALLLSLYRPVLKPSAPITFAPLLTFSISRKIPTMIERIAHKIIKILRKFNIPAGR